MKVIINSDYGGFSLSDEAIEEYAIRKGITLIRDLSDKSRNSSYYFNSVEPNNLFCEREIDRSDPTLVAVVEILKEKANGFCASLKVVEIPDDVNWYVEEYDGMEWVAEKHRTWR
jgi:hypothetical protein